MFRKSVCVIFVFAMLFADGLTPEYFNSSSANLSETKFKFADGDKQRLPRLLTFNTEEDGDVGVELEFRVPFLSIPVKKALNTVQNVGGWGQGGIQSLPSANVNLGAIILAGAIVFGAAVVIPAFGALVSKKQFLAGGMEGGYSERKPEERKYDEDDIWKYKLLLDKMLEEHNIDTSSCIQRVMCRVTKNAATKLKNGNFASHDLLISGLVTNSFFNNLIKNTYMHGAIDSGLGDTNCLVKYKDCRVNQKTIHRLVNKLSSFINFNMI